MSLTSQFILLALLLVASGFFSMSETAMMASNRHRLRHLAKEGNRGAQLATQLLGKVDRLLGVILLGNTLVNAAAAMLTGHIALVVFGAEKWALEAGTLFVTFCLLVFSEITPKVVGATYPDVITRHIGFVLTPLLRISYPVIWFVNLFVTALLKLLRLQPKAGHEAGRVSSEDLRAMVLEAGQFIPHQHQSMLLNLFDLEKASVEDVMTPRGEIEGIDLHNTLEDIRQRLGTSFHSRLPVYEKDPGNVVGILHHRRLLASAIAGDFDLESLQEKIVPPYYVPAGTTLYTQLAFFLENRQRIALVVDEYGEILGLLTLEDIIEDIIGKFTTSLPGNMDLIWECDEDGVETVIVDGARTLRELNRALLLDFPLQGPKTINGLILEHLQDIPESGLSMKIGNTTLEILQAQDRRIRVVRIFNPKTQPICR